MEVLRVLHTMNPNTQDSMHHIFYNNNSLHIKYRAYLNKISTEELNGNS